MDSYGNQKVISMSTASRTAARSSVFISRETGRRIVPIPGLKKTQFPTGPTGKKHMFRGQHSAPANTRILVIDDDRDVRNTICENLRDCGYEVLDAGNGAVGLQLMDNIGYPEIVITDIIMPEKEGLETIMEIRKKQPGVKIIAMSGGGHTRFGNFLDMAKNLGADASFPKPVDMDRLEEAIKKFVA